MRASQSVFVVSALLFVCGVGFVVVGAREGIRNTKIGEYSEALRAFA